MEELKIISEIVKNSGGRVYWVRRLLLLTFSDFCATIQAYLILPMFTKFKWLLGCILLMAGFVFPVDFVFAANYTPIQYDYNGGISTQTLIKDKSPYYVYGGCMNNTLKSGKTLTIEAGVVVKFENVRSCGFWGTVYTSLSINGNLIINGTVEEPIIFTSYHDDASGGDTNGDGNTTVRYTFKGYTCGLN